MLGYIHGREARPSSTRWIILKTVSQTAVFWLVFLLLLPIGIVALEEFLSMDQWQFRSVNLVWCGGVLFVLGGALGVTSSMLMSIRGRGTPLPADCARELVVAGPYRYVRNPMAVGGLLQGVAVGLMLGSPAVVAYAVLGGPVWHLLVRPWEETDLLRRFGEPYQRYRDSVRCWIPCFPGYRAGEK